MTQEIKLKLEQAAETAWEQDQKTNPSPVNPHAYVYGYKAGAQTILDNPSEWGLVNKDSIAYDISNIESQLAKYRDAFDSILDMPKQDYTLTKVQEIIREAIKQEGTK